MDQDFAHIQIKVDSAGLGAEIKKIDALKAVMQDLISAVGNLGTALQGAGDAVQNIADDMDKAVRGMVADLGSAMKDMSARVKDMTSNMGDAVKSLIAGVDTLSVSTNKAESQTRRLLSITADVITVLPLVGVNIGRAGASIIQAVTQTIALEKALGATSTRAAILSVMMKGTTAVMLLARAAAIGLWTALGPIGASIIALGSVVAMLISMKNQAKNAAAALESGYDNLQPIIDNIDGLATAFYNLNEEMRQNARLNAEVVLENLSAGLRVDLEGARGNLNIQHGARLFKGIRSGLVTDLVEGGAELEKTLLSSASIGFKEDAVDRYVQSLRDAVRLARENRDEWGLSALQLRDFSDQIDTTIETAQSGLKAAQLIATSDSVRSLYNGLSISSPEDFFSRRLGEGSSGEGGGSGKEDDLELQKEFVSTLEDQIKFQNQLNEIIRDNPGLPLEDLERRLEIETRVAQTIADAARNNISLTDDQIANERELIAELLQAEDIANRELERLREKQRLNGVLNGMLETERLAKAGISAQEEDMAGALALHTQNLLSNGVAVDDVVKKLTSLLKTQGLSEQAALELIAGMGGVGKAFQEAAADGAAATDGMQEGLEEVLGTARLLSEEMREAMGAAQGRGMDRVMSGRGSRPPSNKEDDLEPQKEFVSTLEDQIKFQNQLNEIIRDNPGLPLEDLERRLEIETRVAQTIADAARNNISLTDDQIANERELIAELLQAEDIANRELERLREKQRLNGVLNGMLETERLAKAGISAQEEDMAGALALHTQNLLSNGVAVDDVVKKLTSLLKTQGLSEQAALELIAGMGGVGKAFQEAAADGAAATDGMQEGLEEVLGTARLLSEEMREAMGAAQGQGMDRVMSGRGSRPPSNKDDDGSEGDLKFPSIPKIDPVLAILDELKPESEALIESLNERLKIIKEALKIGKVAGADLKPEERKRLEEEANRIENRVAELLNPDVSKDFWEIFTENGAEAATIVGLRIAAEIQAAIGIGDWLEANSSEEDKSGPLKTIIEEFKGGSLKGGLKLFWDQFSQGGIKAWDKLAGQHFKAGGIFSKTDGLFSGNFDLSKHQQSIGDLGNTIGMLNDFAEGFSSARMFYDDANPVNFASNIGGALSGDPKSILNLVKGFIGGISVTGTGLRASIGGDGAVAEDATEKHEKRLWGLISNKWIDYEHNAGISGSLGQSALNLQKDVGEMAAQLGAGLGDLSGVFHDFYFSTKDLSQEQIQKRLEQEMLAYGDKLAGQVHGLGAYLKEGESHYDALVRLSQALPQVNTMFEALGFTLFDMGLSGAAAAAGFADLFGGLEAFNEATSAYYDRFYSDQEKYDFSVGQLSKQLADLGINVVPTTEEAFRSLVDQAMASGNEELAASLIKLSPEMGSVLDQANNLTKSLSHTADSFASINDERFAQALLTAGPKEQAANDTAQELAEQTRVARDSLLELKLMTALSRETLDEQVRSAA